LRVAGLYISTVRIGSTIDGSKVLLDGLLHRISHAFPLCYQAFVLLRRKGLALMKHEQLDNSGCHIQGSEESASRPDNYSNWFGRDILFERCRIVNSCLVSFWLPLASVLRLCSGAFRSA